MSNLIPVRRVFAVGALILAAGLGGGILTPLSPWASAGTAAVAQPESADSARDLDQAKSLSRAFQRAAGKIEPSVVHITSKVVMRGRNVFTGRLTRQEAQGVGSGVIVSADGYILTNNHVVAEADEVIVKVNDGRQLPGTVVGTDPSTDLAVVKVDATGLPAAEFGDSDALEVGEWVLAVGSPFGTFDNTVTAGIVSAMNRTGLAGEGERFEEFIQTDAAINPGNSGGPLVNLDGRVVGINSQIASRNGGSVGIGFSIPASIARSVMEMLVKNGKIDRGWLGVTMAELTPEDAAKAGVGLTPMGVARGVLVRDVVAGGPAEKAGLKAGDVIVGFNGRAMAGSNRLRNSIAYTPPGTNAKVDILRAGAAQTITIPLADMNSGRRLALGAVAVPRLGLSVASAPQADVARLDPSLRGGAVVVDVDAGGLASRAGLEAGDLIVAINQNDITDAQDFAKVASRLDLRRQNRFDVIGYRDGALQKGFVPLGGDQ